MQLFTWKGLYTETYSGVKIMEVTNDPCTGSACNTTHRRS